MCPDQSRAFKNINRYHPFPWECTGFWATYIQVSRDRITQMFTLLFEYLVSNEQYQVIFNDKNRLYPGTKKIRGNGYVLHLYCTETQMSAPLFGYWSWTLRFLYAIAERLINRIFCLLYCSPSKLRASHMTRISPKNKKMAKNLTIQTTSDKSARVHSTYVPGFTV